jgi:hypothetical protein
MANLAERIIEAESLECTVCITTNARLEITFNDCIDYDLPAKWIGQEAVFANFVIFDGVYSEIGDSESYLEFEFMSAVMPSLDTVMGVRDLSDHGDFRKRGITVEIDAEDMVRDVSSDLFEEFELELLHMDDPETEIENMMQFNAEVLRGGAMQTIVRYTEEFRALEASR